MTKAFNSLIERFLVFLTVSSFMLVITSMAASVFNNPVDQKIFINYVTYIVLIISGIIFLLIHQIFVQEKIKPYLHIIVIVFYEIIAVIFCGLFRQMNLPYILIPLLLIQYALLYCLNNMFVYHDLFAKECGELKGRELETHLFHNNLSAIDFGAKVKLASTILICLPFILFLLIFAYLKSGRRLSCFDLGFIIIFFLSEFFYFLIIGIYKNDVFFGFLGFTDYIADKRKLLFSCLTIFFGACIFAIVFSSNKALLKITIKEIPISTINQQNQSNAADYLYEDFYNPASDLEKLFPDKKSLIPEWLVDLILGIIKWGAITAISISLIVFFFKPFFSAHWRDFWKEGRLFKFLRNLIKELKEFFKSTFAKRKTVEPYSTLESKKFGQGVKDFLRKAGRSKEKNAEIDRLTKHFMKLIDWGQAHNITYRENLAPAEYTTLIEKAVNGVSVEAAHSAGLLFEKALYDKELLTSDQESNFINSIKIIIKG